MGSKGTNLSSDQNQDGAKRGRKNANDPAIKTQEISDILGMDICLDSKYRPQKFEFPMHPDLKRQITDEIRKNRAIVVRGRRVRALFNYLYDKCDEEPWLTHNDDKITPQERVKVEKAKNACDIIREEANILWCTTGEFFCDTNGQRLFQVKYNF